MITTPSILPLKAMKGEDWNKIFSGFVINSTADWHTPQENIFSEQILTYLLNERLFLSNYSDYQVFCFCSTIHIAQPIFYYPEGIRIIDEYQEVWIHLEVYMPDAQQFANATKHQALRMIAQLMLDSIPNYLFHRTDFDGQKFYHDILPILKPIADGIRTFRDEEFPL